VEKVDFLTQVTHPVAELFFRPVRFYFLWDDVFDMNVVGAQDLQFGMIAMSAEFDLLKAVTGAVDDIGGESCVYKFVSEFLVRRACLR